MICVLRFEMYFAMFILHVLYQAHPSLRHEGVIWPSIALEKWCIVIASADSLHMQTPHPCTKRDRFDFFPFSVSTTGSTEGAEITEAASNATLRIDFGDGRKGQSRSLWQWRLLPGHSRIRLSNAFADASDNATSSQENSIGCESTGLQLHVCLKKETVRIQWDFGASSPDS